jgi:dTDP-4-amino-4,6-dideoxygalactose transaminase
LDEHAVVKNDQCIHKESGRVIKACVPMHTFGFPVEIGEIVRLCQEYNIAVVEDAAESLGSYYENKHTGTFGLMGTFSFNGNKTVTCGGGGAIVTNDEELAKKAKYLTTTAKVPHKWEYMHDEIGYNYRMPNINAALACAQLEQLEMYLINKRETAKSYETFFENVDDINFLTEPKNSLANYWLNVLKFKSKEERNSFLEASNNTGIMTRPVWELMNNLSMFKHCPSDDLDVSKRLSNVLVNIPSSVTI